MNSETAKGFPDKTMTAIGGPMIPSFAGCRRCLGLAAFPPYTFVPGLAGAVMAVRLSTAAVQDACNGEAAVAGVEAEWRTGEAPSCKPGAPIPGSPTPEAAPSHQVRPTGG